MRSYQLTPARVTELRGQYAAQICADDDEFWAQRADCAYAALADVTHVRVLPGLAFAKKDRRGWVQLTCPQPPGNTAMTTVNPAVVAIAGPIGSGKTTTAALLARQRDQDTGQPAPAPGTHATELALPAVRDHAGLIITVQPLTPRQVTGQIVSYLATLSHAPGGRCA